MNKRNKRNRESVLWFAQEMENTLKANSAKGDWAKFSIGELLVGLISEMDELEGAIYAAEDAPETDQTVKVYREAIDVANYAMMIADVARKMNAETGTSAELEVEIRILAGNRIWASRSATVEELPMEAGRVGELTTEATLQILKAMQITAKGIREWGQGK